MKSKITTPVRFLGSAQEYQINNYLISSIKINVILIILLLCIVPAAMAQKKSKAFDSKDYALFGDKFKVTKIYTKNEMLKKYKKLKKGDTITVQFQSNIKQVCKKKGCWMKMELAGDNESFVKFKDYGFFIPTNSQGFPITIEGVATLTETDVETLRHYAEDQGKSKEEVAAITSPKKEITFEASGALIKAKS